MGNTLEFIYTGKVQIMWMKTTPQTLSERYHCEELSSQAKTIILKNFTSLYACNQEEVLNMSSKGLERLISSDEMHISSVSVEEDVFNTILVWINHDKSKQKK